MVGIGKAGMSSILRGLSRATESQTKLVRALSSGVRAFSEDPAGGAISAKLDSIVRQLGQANRNSNDGISSIAIADAAAGEIANINVRRQELATQAANGTLSDDQRATLDAEFQALGAEVDRIKATTEFNGTPLLSGGDITIQAGIGSGAESQVSIENVDIDTSSTSSLSIATQAGALASLEPLESFTSSVTQLRGTLGAAEKRLEVNISNNSQSIVNTEEANSRIRDIDFAQETAKLTAANILADANTALLAQGNQSRRSVLDLLG